MTAAWLVVMCSRASAPLSIPISGISMNANPLQDFLHRADAACQLMDVNELHAGNASLCLSRNAIAPARAERLAYVAASGSADRRMGTDDPLPERRARARRCRTD